MASRPSTSTATMSKSSVSEASTTSVGKIPTSLLWCRLFRPKISGCGCALLVLCATCFVAAVSINRGLLAWSSIFAAETVVPKGAIHQAGWRAVTRNITTTSVPTVRTRRPVASHASIAPAKQGLDRRRPRKVAAAERVRLDTEETEEEIVPPVVISTAVSGSNHEASGPHRRGTARAHHRRSRTVRSKSIREPPDDADEIFPGQETAMPTDLPSLARTPQDDGDENSLGTSSESDSGETVTESPETEMSGMPMTDMAQPSSPRDDNMPASADSSKITEFSAITEILPNQTTGMWESKFENSSELYSLNSKALSLSPKLSSVTDSKEETVYETDRLTGDSEQPKGHSPTGSMDMSASPQPLSTTVDLLHFETLRWPTQVIDDHEELPANESSSTESPFPFSSTTNSNSTDDTEDENEEESTAPSSMSSAYNDFESNATDVTETKPEVNSSTPTALDSVTGVHSTDIKDDEYEDESTAPSFMPSAYSNLTSSAPDVNETKPGMDSWSRKPDSFTALYSASSSQITRQTDLNYNPVQTSESPGVQSGQEEPTVSAESSDATDFILASSVEMTGQAASNYSMTGTSESPHVESSPEIQSTSAELSDLNDFIPASSVEITGQTASSYSQVQTYESPAVDVSAEETSASVEDVDVTDFVPAFSVDMTGQAAANYSAVDTSRTPDVEVSSEELEPSGATDFIGASSAEMTENRTSYYTAVETSESPDMDWGQEQTSASIQSYDVTDLIPASSVEMTVQTASHYNVVETSQSASIEVNPEEMTSSVEKYNATDVIPALSVDMTGQAASNYSMMGTSGPPHMESSPEIQSTFVELSDLNDFFPASSPEINGQTASSYSPVETYESPAVDVSAEDFEVTDFVPASSAEMTENRTSYHTAVEMSESPDMDWGQKQTSSSMQSYDVTDLIPASSVEMTAQTASHYNVVETSQSASIEASPQEMTASVETFNATDIILASSVDRTEQEAMNVNDTTLETLASPATEARTEETSLSMEPFVTDYIPASSVELTEVPASNYSTVKTSETPAVEAITEETLASVEPYNVTDFIPASSAEMTEQTAFNHSAVGMSESRGTESTSDEMEMESTDTIHKEVTYTVKSSEEITTAPANTSPHTESSKVTVSDWTTAGTQVTKRRTRRKTDHEAVECNTTFCKAEASYLFNIFHSGRNPCDNFYEYACADWQAMSSDSQQYDTADDALTGSVEEMARTVLDGGQPAEFQPMFNLWTACTERGSVMDDELKNVLASFGLNVRNAATVTTSDVLQAAGILLYKLDNAPIVSVELIANPSNATSKSIALGEPDILVSRADVELPASKKKLSALACKFFASWAQSGDRNDTLCDAAADVAFELAKLSLLDHHVTHQVNFYAVTSYAYVRMFMPLLIMMNGTKDYMGTNATYVIKNSLQMGALKDLLASKPSDVMAYMAFHTTVYLSPYLSGKEELWGHAMFMLTGSQRPQPVPKWRLCLRLIDKLLPGPLVVAFEKADRSKPFFADLVAEVMVEEVRSAFIDEVIEIERLENWTKYILTLKAQSIGVHTFFTAQSSINVFVNDTARKMQQQIAWKKNPFEYFLAISAFVAKDWANVMRHPLIEQRRGLSLFDSDCKFNPQENVVVVPLAMFNFSMPTSMWERMFHIPRIGTRISACLFRATFSLNNPTDAFTIERAPMNLNHTQNCLTPLYKNKGEPTSGFEKVEDFTAVNVAYETFQERLFSKHYLKVDYMMQGLSNVTADQLFFVYYALSRCGRSGLNGGAMMTVQQDSVNVPLMNFPEFANAFKCRTDSPMNPSNRCSFWN